MSSSKSTLPAGGRRADTSRLTGELSVPSLRDVLTVIFRHWRFSVLVAVAVVAAGVVYAMRLPTYYRSEARLLLSGERGSLALNPASEGLVTGQPTGSRNSVKNEMNIMQSREIAEAVADEIGPGVILGWPQDQTAAEVLPEASDPEGVAKNAAVKTLQKILNVSSDGDIMTASVQHAYAENAHAILDALVDKYLERHIQIHKSSASPEFFREKAGEIEGQIEAQQAILRKLKEKYDISSITEQKVAAFERVNVLETQLSTLRGQIDASKAKVESLEGLVKARSDETGLAPGEIENPRVTELKNRLLELELQKIELESQFVDSRDLRMVKQQIAAIEDKIDQLPATLPPQAAAAMGADDPAVALENERVNLAGLRATEQSILKDLKDAQARLAELEEHETQALMAQQELAHLRTSYLEYRKGLEKAEISMRLDRDKVSNVSIVQPATLPVEPIRPQRTRNVLMFAFAALLLGVGGAFVLEYLDDTVKTPDDVENKLGMAVLATVPKNEFKKCI